MKIQNIHNGVTNEVTKEQWKALGKSQKVFRVLDEKDSPKIKEQAIINTIGKAPVKETPVKKEEESKTKHSSNTKT